MKILVVSHPPLRREIGAANTALCLAAALTAHGHDAVPFSPEPLPAGTRWWNRFRAQQRAIEAFVLCKGPFDVLDLPAISVSPSLAKAGFVVARSVQPDLLYLRVELLDQLRRRPSLRLPFHLLAGAAAARAIRRGFERAGLILCLGSLERDGMRRRLPHLTPKLAQYLHAPAEEDRAGLLALRRLRRPPAPSAGCRFLWLGRWVAHKGTAVLLRFLRARAAVHPSDTFTIAGCGEDASKALPPDLLAAGRVRPVPSFTRAELLPLLLAHDAGLFTSSVEGWGQSLQEMLESGLPVFATRAGAVPELTPYFPRSLLPFPPPDERATPELEDLSAGNYLARFSWPAIAGDYLRQLAERGVR